MITDKLSLDERMELMRVVRAWGDAQLQLGMVLGACTDAAADREARWLADWTFNAVLDLVYGPVLAREACDG